MDKGEVFRDAIRLPEMLAHPCGTCSARTIKLSSLNARSADPHTDVGQPLHVDMGAIPDEQGYWVCNTVWLLDDFTPDNGADTHDPGIAQMGDAAAGRARRSDWRRIRRKCCSSPRPAASP